MANRNLIPIKNFPRKLRDPKKALEYLKKDPPESWERRGQKMALDLFHEMAKRVPAYRDFLKKNDIKPASISTFRDFQNIPTIDKDNYLRKYALDKLSWDGKLTSSWAIYSSTSGSSGKPFYFPRDDYEDWEYSALAELYLLNHYDIDKKTTLYINGFAMGAWIGGLFTYQALKNLAQRGSYKLGVINPGINKIEILNALKALAKYYDQIIIGGYPPFIKDLVDYAVQKKFNWSSVCVKFIFSAEAFNEDFRDYVLSKAKCKNIYADSLNHYGTVDMGTMAHETPLAVYIRRNSLKISGLFTELFHRTEKVPTLTQYIPELYFFEIGKINNLICTSRSGLPLVRYDLKDLGGILSFKSVVNKLNRHCKNWKKDLADVGLQKTIWKLPFVYLYERSDFALTWFGATIYPENIRKALGEKELLRYTTGRFAMLLVEDKKFVPRLQINVELKKNAQSSPQLVDFTKRMLVKVLTNENSEYRSSSLQQKNGLMPQVIFWKNGHKKYFSSANNKQQWIIK